MRMRMNDRTLHYSALIAILLLVVVIMIAVI